MENDELITQPEPTLREMIAENLRDAADDQEPIAPGAKPEAVPADAPQVATPEEAKPGKTAGRPRDEKGRLLPGKPILEPAPVIEAQPAPAPASKPAWQPKWPKEALPVYDKLMSGQAITPDEARQMAAQIEKRERDFATGVSTYRGEWEQAKPLIDAVTPYMATIQQHGLKVQDVVARTLQAHHTLALAQPQDKLAMFQQLARDYQIPAQLAVQDAQGNWQLLAQQPAPQQTQPQQPQFNPADLDKMIEEKLMTRQSLQTVADFERDAPEHYAVVKQDMAGLLQAGLANDLQSAYDAALRLPKHADIFEAIQAKDRAEKDAAQKAANQAKVTRARSAAVGVRSATPGATSQAAGDKSLRETIADNLSAVGGGRV